MRNSKQSVCFALVLAFLMQTVAAQTVGRVTEPKAPKNALKWEGQDSKDKGVLVPLASLEVGDKITITREKEQGEPDYYVLLEVGDAVFEVTFDGNKKTPERSNMKAKAVKSPYVILKPDGSSGSTGTAVAVAREIGSWVVSWWAEDDVTWKPAITKSENDGKEVGSEILGIPMLMADCSSSFSFLKEDNSSMVMTIGWTQGKDQKVKIKVEEVKEKPQTIQSTINLNAKTVSFSPVADQCYKMTVTDQHDVLKAGYIKVVTLDRPIPCQEQEVAKKVGKIPNSKLEKSIHDVVLASCLLNQGRDKWALQAYQLVAGIDDYYPAKLMSLGLRRGLRITE